MIHDDQAAPTGEAPAVVEVTARVADEHARAHGLPAVIERVDWFVERSNMKSSPKEVLTTPTTASRVWAEADENICTTCPPARDTQEVPAVTTAWNRARPLGGQPHKLPPDVEKHQLAQLAKARALFRKMKGYFEQDAGDDSPTTPPLSDEAADKAAVAGAGDAAAEERVLRALVESTLHAARGHTNTFVLEGDHQRSFFRRRPVENQAASSFARFD